MAKTKGTDAKLGAKNPRKAAQRTKKAPVDKSRPPQTKKSKQKKPGKNAWAAVDSSEEEAGKQGSKGEGSAAEDGDSGAAEDVGGEGAKGEDKGEGEDEGEGGGAGAKPGAFCAAEVYQLLKHLRFGARAWAAYDRARASGQRAQQNALSALKEMECRGADDSRHKIVVARVDIVWGVFVSTKRPAFGRMIEAISKNMSTTGALQARDEKVWTRKIGDLSRRYNVRKHCFAQLTLPTHTHFLTQLPFLCIRRSA